MKPLQPILDMLERADNPRMRVREAMKPKPTKPVIAQDTNNPFMFEMMRRQALINDKMIRQQNAQQLSQYQHIVNPLMRGAF